MSFLVSVPLLTIDLLAGTIGMTTNLTGNGWRPSHVATFTLPTDSRMFVEFKPDGRISGNGGCNAFFGPYTVSGNTIKIGRLLSTRKGCPGLIQAEVKFLAMLESATTFEVQDDKLLLFDAAGSELAEFVLASN